LLILFSLVILIYIYRKEGKLSLSVINNYLLKAATFILDVTDHLFEAAVVEINPNANLNSRPPIQRLIVKFAFYANVFTAINISLFFTLRDVNIAVGYLFLIIYLYLWHRVIERFILKEKRPFFDTGRFSTLLLGFRIGSIVGATIGNYPALLIGRLLS
jgi:hypothetical protein